MLAFSIRTHLRGYSSNVPPSGGLGLACGIANYYGSREIDVVVLLQCVRAKLLGNMMRSIIVRTDLLRKYIGFTNLLVDKIIWLKRMNHLVKVMNHLVQEQE